MYKYVEQPFRRTEKQLPAGSNKSDGVFGVAIFAVAIILAMVSGNIWKNDGWTWRVSSEFYMDAHEYNESFYGGNGYDSNKVITLGDDFSSDRIIFVGDSFGLQYAKAIDSLASTQKRKVIALFDHGCLIFPDVTRYIKGVESNSCSAEYQKLVHVLRENLGANVLLANNWEGYRNKLGYRDALSPLSLDATLYDELIIDQLLKLFAESGSEREYFLVGTPHSSGGFNTLTCLTRPTLIPGSGCEQVQPETEHRMNIVLRNLSEDIDNVTYVDPNLSFCKDNFCRLVADGKPIHSDKYHLSVYGADIFVPDLFEIIFSKDNPHIKAEP